MKAKFFFQLSEAIKRAGTPIPFEVENADFGNMTENEDRLVISNVIHQARVEVDEDGTEAAAATAVVMMLTSSIHGHYEEPIDFICNRPFLFIIHEKIQNNVLFIGKLADPN